MNKPKTQQTSNLSKVVKKLSLSAFVVVSFAAYALEKPANPNATLGMITQTPSVVVPPQVLTATPQAELPTSTALAQQTNIVTPTSEAPTAEPPTAVPPTAIPVVPTATSGYQDGTYTGPEVDAIYGLVQVQTVVQSGKIVNVQALKYPTDRRTSQRINAYAVPFLQQEAIQAQSANVNLVTGATLTSEAFQMSLQAALSKAKGGA